MPMNEQTQTPAPATVPQHIIDRFESEWRQMRQNAAASQRPAQSSDATRDHA